MAKTIKGREDATIDANRPIKSVSGYEEMEKLIEMYKVSNPVKYELKKEELERKLAKLK